MTTLFKPMLATDADLNKLRFPLLASAKLDGVRAVVRGGVVYSRSNKPIPNKWVQANLSHLEHFDGELIVGQPTSKTCYRDTVSEVMSHDKTGGCAIYVFDHVKDGSLPYSQRYDLLDAPSHVIKHEQIWCKNLRDILKYEELCLDRGYEGLILRDPTAPYKMGRSTVNEGSLLKLKRFSDDECIVIGFEERMHNANEAVTNELGRTSRSSHKAGKQGLDTLGALNCRFGDVEFSIGTGFTDAERAQIWGARSQHLGRIAKFKHFTVGAKDAPRHPVFLGWRDKIDL
jgi:DNA ligase-1